MSQPTHSRLPVREHLGPRPRRRILTEDDIDPDLLRRFPDSVAELNIVPADVWQGHGQPGHVWVTAEVPLAKALVLRAAGDA